MPSDVRSSVSTHIDALNKAMPEFRTHEARMKGLKAEVAAANVSIGLSDPKVGSAELSRLVERYLDAW